MKLSWQLTVVIVAAIAALVVVTAIVAIAAPELFDTLAAVIGAIAVLLFLAELGR